MEFNCTEQYMMYAKALLFSDLATATRIMGAPAPLEQKKLGRKVAGFDDEVWCARRERIVEEGNWWKFCDGRNREMRAELLGTGERELVEVCAFMESKGDSCGIDGE
jgi:ribA/ribD-fused uncharacterized protein